MLSVTRRQSASASSSVRGSFSIIQFVLGASGLGIFSGGLGSGDFQLFIRSRLISSTTLGAGSGSRTRSRPSPHGEPTNGLKDSVSPSKFSRRGGALRGTVTSPPDSDACPWNLVCVPPRVHSTRVLSLVVSLLTRAPSSIRRSTISPNCTRARRGGRGGSGDACRGDEGEGDRFLSTR